MKNSVAVNLMFVNNTRTASDGERLGGTTWYEADTVMNNIVNGHTT